jgi:hypothetical protein
MEYKAGSHIPEKEILKRYEDEDGETFLEVRGVEDALFRVTTGNQVYYKIEKSLMVEEELTLVDDFSRVTAASEPEIEFAAGEFEAPLEISPEMLLDEEEAAPEAGGWTSRKKEHRQVTELEEGQQVPEKLKPLCIKNAYGGYTLRYNRFLYLLGSDYRVEMKSADSMSDYQLEGEDDVTLLEPRELVDAITPDESSAEQEMGIELQRGETLPLYMREQCEEDISTGGGCRITIGDYLYLLDPDYRVTVKMKLSYSHAAASTSPTAAAEIPVPESKKPGEKEPPKKQPSVKKIISGVVKHFKAALKKYNISADFFKETVLSSGSREVLTHVYDGDLTELNDDTREAASQGKQTVLEEKGFTLFRAALLHELYIKSTFAGRGENMKYFVTYIASIEPDGTLEEARFDDKISLEQQREMVEFFSSRRKEYSDKAGIITRVHHLLRKNAFNEYNALRQAGENVRFNAFLIAKLYEHTTRLDRGDGITMIRLSRDLMDYET